MQQKLFQVLISLGSDGWESRSEQQLCEGLRARPEDVIIVDTPRAHTPFVECFHASADLIITPLNDSLVGLSVIAEIDPNTGSVVRPNQYAEAVWTARHARAARDGGSIAWAVLRNRLSTLDAHNRRMMADVLGKKADRLEFTAGPGFGERVIFRELFLQRLTLSDFEDRTAGLAWTVSHVAARQELRDLLERVECSLDV